MNFIEEQSAGVVWTMNTLLPCVLLQDVSERKIRFTSNYSPNVLFEHLADIVRQMDLQIQKALGKVSPILDILIETVKLPF